MTSEAAAGAAPALDELAREAEELGWRLRLQVNRPLGLWTLRVVVVEIVTPGRARLLGELKGWAYARPGGLQLDTLRVSRRASAGVSDLIWAATFAWALEVTPCRRARLLAIRDDDRQHRRLVRYFRQRGFRPLREVGSAPLDLALRLVWGGAGLLMGMPCDEGLRRSAGRWRSRLPHSRQHGDPSVPPNPCTAPPADRNG
jgi:hypothetical protein